MAVVTRFVKANQRLCRLLDRYWAYPKWADYSTEAGKLAAAARPPRVVDVGAGRQTPYAPAIAGRDIALIGIDVLADHMADNAALSERIVTDVASEGFPEEATGAGLITSRMVLEHVADQEHSAAAIYAALAPGGKTIHLFAARYSAFAIANRLLPEAVAERLLFALRPASVDVGGFKTHYDKTNTHAAERVFQQAGFTRVETEVSYEVSQYFEFLFPLYVLARAWESTLKRLRLKNLASYVLLVAEKPADEQSGDRT